jgi:hypothetical protein
MATCLLKVASSTLMGICPAAVLEALRHPASLHGFQGMPKRQSAHQALPCGRTLYPKGHMINFSSARQFPQRKSAFVQSAFVFQFLRTQLRTIESQWPF